MEQYLEAGRIINTHGIAGFVKIESWCDSPGVLASLGTLYLKEADGTFLPLKIIASSVHKHMALTGIEGVDTLDKALKYKNRVVWAHRDDLPLSEGSHFIADLLGLPVIDADSGTSYGILTGVTNNGANDVYEITKNGDIKAYMPAVGEFVIRIDYERGIFIRPIEGMFE
ncbi:MAG: ribosome maturation factor RimM [Eubacteriales bacterium]|jgi:16S rRNA processing protein RimM|nr:ribosome maturation factor RimM [Eubacteriales bacterium]